MEAIIQQPFCTNRTAVGVYRTAVGTNRRVRSTNRSAVDTNRRVCSANRSAVGSNGTAVGVNRGVCSTNRTTVGSNRSAVGTNRGVCSTNRTVVVFKILIVESVRLLKIAIIISLICSPTPISKTKTKIAENGYIDVANNKTCELLFL